MKASYEKAVGFTLAIKTPITAVANSGAEDPAAMKVAPATSCDICKAVKKGKTNIVEVDIQMRGLHQQAKQLHPAR
jgi:hypothetical protein